MVGFLLSSPSASSRPVQAPRPPALHFPTVGKTLETFSNHWKNHPFRKRPAARRSTALCHDGGHGACPARFWQIPWTRPGRSRALPTDGQPFSPCSKVLRPFGTPLSSSSICPFVVTKIIPCAFHAPRRARLESRTTQRRTVRGGPPLPYSASGEFHPRVPW